MTTKQEIAQNIELFRFNIHTYTAFVTFYKSVKVEKRITVEEYYKGVAAKWTV